MYTTLVDVNQLEENLDNDQWVILDCRFNLMERGAGLDLFKQGHIPNAQYADLEQDLSSPITANSGRHPLPDEKKLASKMGAWGITPDTQVVLYDDMSGAMAARAWWLLRWLGHAKVALLDGGIEAWKNAGHRLTTTETSRDKMPEYPINVKYEWVLSSNDILENIKQPSFLLVDTRNAERFAGEHEPIDAIAGHVPGALNRPLSENLNDDGKFKSPQQLHREWKQLSGNRSCTLMCGSGVTACHNLLSLEIAGITGSRLYAGSWSEWIRDSNRPVSQGYGDTNH